MEQGTKEWLQARAGRVTASRVADIVAKTKSGPAASRANYMAQLICERLTGSPVEGFKSAAMQWGTDMEPLARAAYEDRHGVLVVETGFVPHPTLAMAGASPDGLVGEEGLVEIKCPETATHLDTLLSGSVPGRYQIQMLWQMACTGRAWCDFVSFDPRLPANMQLFVARVERDEKKLVEISGEVEAFLGELDQKIQKLTEKYK